MIVRLKLENIYSFNNEVEFNMLPYPKFTRLNEHKYKKCNLNILKMAAIYGANGAGKSNLIKALSFVKGIIINETISTEKNDIKFKLNKENESKSQSFFIEIISNDIPYSYYLEINYGKVIKENLYISGLGKKDDTLIFERTVTDNTTKFRFSEDFYKSGENKLLSNIIEKNLSQPGKSIIKLLTTLDNDYFNWFLINLTIITPEMKPNSLLNRIELSQSFKEFANNLMCSLHIGVTDISLEKSNIDINVLSSNNDVEIISSIEKSPNKMISMFSSRGIQLVVGKDETGYYTKELKLEHSGNNDYKKIFELDNESDGTIRILDFIPLFYDIGKVEKVYFVDEIERSIHPLLIKKLIELFSNDISTKGQIIFSTHDSNLLDQTILRQDEIWFVEKNLEGASEMYPLSEFKVHSTKDIQKGYLDGRYGSIPFLSNMKDLNWK